MTKILLASFICGVTCAATFEAVPSITEIVSVEDLETEMDAKYRELTDAMSSLEKWQATTQQRRYLTTQLSIICQSLVLHGGQSSRKNDAAILRDAVLKIGKTENFEAAQLDFKQLQMNLNGGSVAPVEIPTWRSLRSTHTLMESLRERTDQIRKSLRRSKDVQAESRQAMTMALIGIAIADHAMELPDAIDQDSWRNWSIELQSEMTKTATAIRTGDRNSALESFKSAQVTCDRCHERFKK